MLFPDLTSLLSGVADCLARYAVDLQSAINGYRECVAYSGNVAQCASAAKAEIFDAYFAAASCLLF